MPKVNLQFAPPITDTGTLPELNGKAQSISLKNAGTAKVLLNGMYSIAAGETASFNVDDTSTLGITNINVTFDTSTGVSKRLEIAYLIAQLSC